MDEKYVVGIDLGTTNSVVADVTADPEAEHPPIELRPVPQLVNPGEVASRTQLPSFLFVPGEADFAAGATALPWDDAPRYVVGELARKRGAENPARLVASAKSWLSHSGAPPFQMYVLPQKLEKLAFAGTATILFAIINAAKLIPYWELNSFSAIDPKLPLLVLPVGILGTWVGAKLTRVLPDRLFFALVQAALFLVSLKLVWDFF